MDNRADYKVEKKKFKLIPLMPVHIGSEGTIDPLEYVIIDGVLYLLDMEKLMEIESVRRFVLKEKDNYIKIRRMLFEKCRNDLCSELRHFSISRVKVSPTVQEKYQESLSRMDSKLDISLLPRNPCAYLPGSSIKGAIRTGVLNEINIEISKETGRKRICDSRMTRRNGKLDPIAVEHCLLCARENGKNEFALSMFQYFCVSDVVVEGKTGVILVNRPSFNKGGKGIPSYREVFCDGQVTVEIVFASSRFQRIREEKHKHGPKASGIDDFLYRADSFYRRKLKDEIARIKKAKKLDEKQDIIFSLIEIEKKREEAGEDAYLLRIGFGSGYDYVTLEEYRHWKNPKPGKPGKGWGYSINLTETRRPLGWVMLEEVN